MTEIFSTLNSFFSTFNGYLWGPFMVAFLFGSGFFLMVGMRFFPASKILFGMKEAWKSRKVDPGPHAITPWQSLMTAMSATVGTGNIVGVATAIAIGGPGAVFWMWMTAIFGLATKFSEVALAIKYKKKDEHGNNVGGPMYYVKYGLSDKIGKIPAGLLGGIFSVCTIFTAFIAGNAIQSNSVVDAIRSSISNIGLDLQSSTTLMGGSIDMVEMVISAVVVFAIGLVIIGGFKRIANVADSLVPFMALSYFLVSTFFVILNADKLPSALSLIVTEAFGLQAAAGGFFGTAMMMAMRYGAARGILSNESGLGSAPIAHGASTATDPVLQGCIGMLGTVIDTLIICTLTALVIIISGMYLDTTVKGVAITSGAFDALSGMSLGKYFVPIALAIFAYTSMLGWSFYGEVATKFLFGDRFVVVFRVIFLLFTFFGGWATVDLVWTLADTANGLMILPNMLAVLLLSPALFKLVKDWKRDKRK